jgi:hypothetical protein
MAETGTAARCLVKFPCAELDTQFRANSRPRMDRHDMHIQCPKSCPDN